MKVVVLTTGGDYGRLVIELLRSRGSNPAAVVVDLHRPRFAEALRHPRRVLGVVRRWVIARRLSGVQLHFLGDANSRRALDVLDGLRPDLIVLAGARILSPAVLSSARVGVLNAHPATLPGFRGNGVVGWSIMSGEAVSVSVHFVEPEVDAGDVIERHLVPVAEGDTLAAIEARADEVGARALADVAARAARGEILPREPQDGSGRLYRRLDAEQRDRVERLVAEGVALQLYRRRLQSG
jgi:folate-dependent phosphoribosylglycinamide formyltransferase PurN